MGLVTCPDCIKAISEAAIACPNCGRPMREAASAAISTQQGAHPSPGIAAVLSLVIPGAGQMYLGSVGLGLILFAGAIFGYLLFILPGLVVHLVSVIAAASWKPPSQQPSAPEGSVSEQQHTPPPGPTPSSGRIPGLGPIRD